MGWITSLLVKKVIADHSKEIDQFITGLKSMSDDEIAELVAYSTHTKHLIERLGVDLFFPNDIYMKNPDLLPELVKQISNFKSQGNHIAASAMMVWAHTIRATTRSDLVARGRAMWTELSRGFSGVEHAKSNIASRTGNLLNTSDSNKIPYSLDSKNDG